MKFPPNLISTYGNLWGDVMSAQQYSRRKAVSSLAATVACAFAGPIPAIAEPVSPGETQNCAGPIFSTTGPNAELYGAKGYSVTKKEQLAPVFKETLANDGFAIVDVQLD